MPLLYTSHIRIVTLLMQEKSEETISDTSTAYVSDDILVYMMYYERNIKNRLMLVALTQTRKNLVIKFVPMYGVYYYMLSYYCVVVNLMIVLFSSRKKMKVLTRILIW